MLKIHWSMQKAVRWKVNEGFYFTSLRLPYWIYCTGEVDQLKVSASDKQRDGDRFGILVLYGYFYPDTLLPLVNSAFIFVHDDIEPFVTVLRQIING